MAMDSKGADVVCPADCGAHGSCEDGQCLGCVAASFPHEKWWCKVVWLNGLLEILHRLSRDLMELSGILRDFMEFHVAIVGYKSGITLISGIKID